MVSRTQKLGILVNFLLGLIVRIPFECYDIVYVVVVVVCVYVNSILFSCNYYSVRFNTFKLRRYTRETECKEPGGDTWVRFCWVCAAGVSEPPPIIVYSVANYRPHLGHSWPNVIVISRTEFNTNRLLNIKTTAEAIFQPRIFLVLNPC